MPLVSALGEQSGLKPIVQEVPSYEAPEREEVELTPEEQEQYEIIRYCNSLYDDARRSREPFETFEMAWNLFVGNVWPSSGWPTWRAKITLQKIRGFITFMQAIMTDNKPRLSVEPLVPGSEDAADLLRKLVDRDWDDNNMQAKLSLFVQWGLIWGTAFMKMTYDPYADGGRGKHLATPVVPYKVFTNYNATSIEDAEYIIHPDDMTMGWIRRNYPAKAEAVYALRGITTQAGGGKERDRDYIREGDGQEQARIISAQSVNGNITQPQVSTLGPDYMSIDRDTVEVMECWLRDDRMESYQRPKIQNGRPVTEPVVREDGSYEMETVGHRLATSSIDGAPFLYPIRQPKQKPVMESAWRYKYPNGRLVMIAAGRVLLRDIPNPFQTDGFPWAMWKDYDVGSFWGQGETLALKDLAIASNRILSEVYNILDKIGNPSYKVAKGMGINIQTIRNKPGAIIPMDDVKAMEPLEKPPIPREFFELFEVIRKSMGEVSGINDSIQGTMPASNTAFATIDQLTEAGSAPIRLKVRNLESGLSRMGKLRVQLIQQWDQGARPIRYTPESLSSPTPDSGDGEGGGEGEVPEPASAVAVQFRRYRNADLQGQVEFSVVPISSLSTSPASVWNKWITLYDKHIVDRRWFLSKFRIEGWRSELPRLEAQEKQDAAMQAAAKDRSKPGPPPKTNPARGHRAKPAPPSHVPTAHQRAHVR